MDQNKSEAPAKKNSFWLDFGPLLIFFASFHYLKREHPDDAMIYAAGILAVAATLALIYAWVRHRHTSPILIFCLLYTSPSPRDTRQSRMPSSA